jgi:hypothetical protein
MNSIDNQNRRRSLNRRQQREGTAEIAVEQEEWRSNRAVHAPSFSPQRDAYDERR